MNLDSALWFLFWIMAFLSIVQAIVYSMAKYNRNETAIQLAGLVITIIIGVAAGTMAMALTPDKPPRKESYVDLYRECTLNREESSEQSCKELATKEIEKNESTTTENN